MKQCLKGRAETQKFCPKLHLWDSPTGRAGKEKGLSDIPTPFAHLLWCPGALNHTTAPWRGVGGEKANSGAPEGLGGEDWSGSTVPEAKALTVLHLGPQLALFGVLKERLVLGSPRRTRLVAAGFIEERPVSTRCCAGWRTNTPRVSSDSQDSQSQRCKHAPTPLAPCTAPHKPDVEVEGNAALDSESLPSRWFKNALCCSGRTGRVILHQLTIEKPEKNDSTSRGCSAPQTRGTPTPVRAQQGPSSACRTKSPPPAAWGSDAGSCGREHLGASEERLTLQERREIARVSCRAEDAQTTRALPGECQARSTGRRGKGAGCCLWASNPTVKKTSRSPAEGL